MNSTLAQEENVTVRPLFILVSGLAGTGKSTSAQIAALDLGVEPFLEDLNAIPAYSAWLSHGGGSSLPCADGIPAPSL